MPDEQQPEQQQDWRYWRSQYEHALSQLSSLLELVREADRHRLELVRLLRNREEQLRVLEAAVAQPSVQSEEIARLQRLYQDVRGLALDAWLLGRRQVPLEQLRRLLASALPPSRAAIFEEEEGEGRPA
jgi:hypothetical protein